ncbi:hypothetical protein ACFX11_034420 [Malus domestica]
MMDVKTGSIIKAGTYSKISITLGDFSSRSVWVPDLRLWGLMGPHYDYFERGNVDVFSVCGPCMDAPVCWLTLTSNGFGAHAGWYCDHVEVTATEPNTASSKSMFYVQQCPHSHTSLLSPKPTTPLQAHFNGCSDVFHPMSTMAFSASSNSLSPHDVVSSIATNVADLGEDEDDDVSIFTSDGLVLPELSKFVEEGTVLREWCRHELSQRTGRLSRCLPELEALYQEDCQGAGALWEAELPHLRQAV